MNYNNKNTVRIFSNLIMLWAGAVAQPVAADMQGTQQEVTFLGRVTTQELMAQKGNAPTQNKTRAPQSLGLDFAALDGAVDGIVITTPGGVGDVGPTQYIIHSPVIRTFDKATGLFDNVLDLSLAQFFASINPSLLGDWRIRYDAMSDRWFLAAEDFVSVPNRVVLAMSDTGIITNCTTWCFFEFPLDYPLDYTTLGVDNDAVYLAPTAYSNSTGFYITPILLVVNKATLIEAEAGTCVTAPFVTTFVLSDTSLYGPVVGGSLIVAQPAKNFDTTTTVGVVIVSQEFAATYPDGIVSLFAFYINNPGGTPSNPPLPSLSSLFNIAPDSYIAQPTPLGLPVQGTNNPVGVQMLVDSRLTGQAAISNGSLYVAQPLGMSNTGNSTDLATIDRVGSRWYEIINLDTVPTITQQGNLVDTITPFGNPNFINYFEPVTMVSGQGHMALGCSLAGTTTYLNAATCGRLFHDPAGMLRLPPVVYPVYSDSSYNLGFEPYFGCRWGEYTTVSLDPSDNMTMWCNQMWCNADNSWACQVVKLLAPPPATPVSASNSVSVIGGPNQPVTITGAEFIEGSGFYNFCPYAMPCADTPGQPTLNYKDPTAFWVKQISATVTNLTGSVAVQSITFNSSTSVTLYLDPSSAIPGNYFVTITNPDQQPATSATAILTVTP